MLGASDDVTTSGGRVGGVVAALSAIDERRVEAMRRRLVQAMPRLQYSYPFSVRERKKKNRGKERRGRGRGGGGDGGGGGEGKGTGGIVDNTGDSRKSEKGRRYRYADAVDSIADQLAVWRDE